jgi:ketosteroid isomerase-like protein
MTAATDADTAAVLSAEESFFSALLAGDPGALAAVLADDFLIVDVMSGQVADRAAILGAVGSGDLEFREVVRDPKHASVRHRPGAAVVVGRTRMTMRFLGSESTVESRYTHVYARTADAWQLLSAQGTPVIDPPTAQ